MTKSDFVIIYLSILLALTQWLWWKDSKALSYLQGRNSVYQEMADNQEAIVYAK